MSNIFEKIKALLVLFLLILGEAFSPLIPFFKKIGEGIYAFYLVAKSIIKGE
jgi:hypothetical protein